MRKTIHREMIGNEELSVFCVSSNSDPTIKAYDFEFRTELSSGKFTGPRSDGTRSFANAEDALAAGRKSAKDWNGGS